MESENKAQVKPLDSIPENTLARKIYSAECYTKRVETGGLQINDDWAGLFIRGDNAIRLKVCIDTILRHIRASTGAGKNVFTVERAMSELKEISDLIENEVIRH